MATRDTSNEIETWKPIYLEGDKRVNVGDGNFSCLTLLQAMGVMKMNKDGIAWRSKAGQGVTVVGTEIRSGEWRRVSRLFQLRLVVKGGVSYKFDGFKEQVSAPDTNLTYPPGRCFHEGLLPQALQNHSL